MVTQQQLADAIIAMMGEDEYKRMIAKKGQK